MGVWREGEFLMGAGYALPAAGGIRLKVCDSSYPKPGAWSPKPN